MHHHHGLMKWLVLACVIPIFLILVLGNKGFGSWAVYVLLGVCVISHVLMMLPGHKGKNHEPAHAGQSGPEKETQQHGGCH